jgi:Phage derived protein Gp49-like (DUF891)
MERTVAYRGLRYTIAYAIERKGGSPGAVFFDALSLLDKAKLMKLFEMLGEHGKITNREKFGDLGDGFREFKSYQIRMPCHFAKGGLVLITHGFIKKKDRVPKEEIERVSSIL